MNSSSKKNTRRASTHSKLRIIGGQWRRRTLNFPAVDCLRPTGDRIRETLFNWLAPHILGTRCLDLFAGSGILSFEALSRGAQSCTLIENHPLALQYLHANKQDLKAEAMQIWPDNALNCLKKTPESPFNIVFIDPPFTLNLWPDVIKHLQQGWLAHNAWIYIETPKLWPLITPTNWRLHRQQHAGQVTYSLYHHQESTSLLGSDSPNLVPCEP